ncbi:branched-chain amino acid transport system II carrier protein [Lutimonas halocynthiae]|uniref:branched-chain amino acid transport system II carrier protein n=1 Tax=Lutimonas halocynthiae TaxID=1446477 RepID=UPI0025B4C9D2|nr:branched-chain amino acid transport system II carrier protein [Lutimonas halocynthiae]MDN3641749.1 branched-chain amino acid transport system II carrier protein [Lutimonas halocynthiae]
MNRTKQIFVLGFAIFASFFGAGNLILPPLLGFNAGSDWWLVAIGFLVSATVIPLLALLGHAKLQGTMIDFGKKVSRNFAVVFSILVYIIAIVLACPRTAAVTHEMAIQPYFEINSLITSTVYFSAVFVFAINRGKVMDFLGKYLTPIIVLILLVIIGIGIFDSSETMLVSQYKTPLISGFLEGYQTYDAIAGLLVGGIIVVNVNNLNWDIGVADKKSIIIRSSLIALTGLFIIYVGLIFLGAKYNMEFPSDISRPQLLAALATMTLGKFGSAFLAVLVSAACFTTAVSIVVGTADFFKGLFNNSKSSYVITVGVSCLFGILMGQFEVKFIIDLAVYALMFIYPMGISLIMLNLLSEKYASPVVFKTVVSLAILFSIPDFLKFLIPVENLEFLYQIVPFSRDGLGWIIPSLLGFVLANVYCTIKNNKA